METISSALTAIENGELLPEQVKSFRSRWNAEQDQIVTDGWGTDTCFDIGKKVGVTKRAVRARARHLGLPLLRTGDFLRNGQWPEEHVQYLIDYWGKLSCSKIGEHVGRTKNSVIGRARRMGLEKLSPYNVNLDNGVKRAKRSAGPSKVRKGPRLPEPTPIIDTLIPFEQRKTLLQLETGDCRWPVGDPGKTDFFFCGGKTFTGRSYCAAHSRRAHERYRPTRSGFQFPRAA